MKEKRPTARECVDRISMLLVCHRHCPSHQHHLQLTQMGSDIVKTMLRKIDWRTANDGEDVGLDGGVVESVGLTGLVGTCETEGRSPGEEAESAVEERRTDSDCVH